MPLEGRNVTNAFHMCLPVILHAVVAGRSLESGIWWPSDAAKLQGRKEHYQRKLLTSSGVWRLLSQVGSWIRGQLPD